MNSKVVSSTSCDSAIRPRHAATFALVLCLILPGCGAGTAAPASGKGYVAASDGGLYSAECKNFTGIARQQETDLWCWAAGIQMVYKYRGVDISQADIVSRIHKRAPGDDTRSAPVKSAIQWEVMAALCPEEEKQFEAALIPVGKKQINLGELLFSTASAFMFTEEDLVESVSGGQPVLLALKHADDPSKGHMFVVYGVTYAPKSQFDATLGMFKPANLLRTNDDRKPEDIRAYNVTQVRAIDPWTGQSVTIADHDFKPRVAYMMSERNVRASFTKMAKSIQ